MGWLGYLSRSVMGGVPWGGGCHWGKAHCCGTPSGGSKKQCAMSRSALELLWANSRP